MSTGLLAILDDVTALMKLAAASADDIPAQIAETSAKVSGIVIDDAAVTPKYVVGLSPKRELAIIYQIAKKSLINKLLYLAPITLLLGFFAPWIIQPILMIGGGYLCLEGYEKVHSIFAHEKAHAKKNIDKITPEELEKIRVSSAVRTDFILSAEIIAITYSTVMDSNLITQIAVLASIAIIITLSVYGFVSLVVKADDVALILIKEKNHILIQNIGKTILKCIPHFLTFLANVGTAAMLWVGAEIIAHGIPYSHHALEELKYHLPNIPILVWSTKASICAISGIAIGFLIEKILIAYKKLSDLL